MEPTILNIIQNTS